MITTLLVAIMVTPHSHLNVTPAYVIHICKCICSYTYFVTPVTPGLNTVYEKIVREELEGPFYLSSKPIFSVNIQIPCDSKVEIRS